MQRRKLVQLFLSIVPIATITPFLTKAQEKLRLLKGGFKVEADKDRWNEDTIFGKEKNMKCKVSGKDTNNNLYVVEENDPVDVGPSLHIHPNQDEVFFITKGNYLVKIGDEVFNLKKGDTAFAPRNIPHCFLTIGEGPHQMILTYQPAGKMEEFFYNRKNPAYTDGKTLEQQFKEHDMEIVGPKLSK
ncbi:cupin domain-containing protein [Spirosoma foliorum]|uniref:Cupin domain-containing protein n=1 Tax=Spirosoma foliorum TaxID=2710596 RepID=A0A7G5H0Y9_9BACT|nr:cupin domain-containing protein [Spirosoma foliorum]QMW04781.1 cupin domain-containing protein [Spirosoma foliorum]